MDSLKGELTAALLSQQTLCLDAEPAAPLSHSVDPGWAEIKAEEQTGQKFLSNNDDNSIKQMQSGSYRAHFFVEDVS